MVGFLACAECTSTGSGYRIHYTVLLQEECGKDGGKQRHSPARLTLLAEELDCPRASNKDLELSLCDTQVELLT